MIAIVNYGSGNIKAIANVYKRLNVPVTVAGASDDLRAADRIIMPGVGAFDWAMQRLNDSGMRGALEEMVIDKRTPVLGICVGMQMMAHRSDEGGGEVERFDVSSFSQRTHLPHMGWNNVQPRSSNGLFKDLDSDARFYFLHSYYFSPSSEDEVLAVTDYNGTFASSVSSGSVLGVQFHPEKSHQWGITLLRNFAEL